MAKKKKKKRKLPKTWVGELLRGNWNKWDYILFGIFGVTVGYLIVFMDYGFKDFLDETFGAIFWALIIGIVVSYVNSAKARAKKS